MKYAHLSITKLNKIFCAFWALQLLLKLLAQKYNVLERSFYFSSKKL